MISRKHSLIISIACLFIFVVSLLLNLHGALAVTSVICFSFLISAIIAIVTDSYVI